MTIAEKLQPPTQEQVVETLQKFYREGDSEILNPLALVTPNYKINSISIRDNYAGDLNLQDTTIAEVLLNCSVEPTKITDWLFTTHAYFYSQPHNIEELHNIAMCSNSARFAPIFAKKGANIHFYYDATSGQTHNSMLKQVLNIQEPHSPAKHNIKCLVMAGASLFEKIDDQYIFEFLKSSTTGNNSTLDLKQRCRTLLFAFATVEYRIKADKLQADSKFAQISSVLNTEPLRNRILDYLI